MLSFILKRILLNPLTSLLSFSFLGGCLAAPLPQAQSIARSSPLGLAMDVTTLATFRFSTSQNFVPGQSFHPLAWSPDSKWLAYILDDSVWLLQSPDFTAKQIINIPQSHLGEVVWSPDGNNLAVRGVQSHGQSPHPTIWGVEVNGSGLKDLTAEMEDASREKFINRWIDNQTFSFTFWRGNGIQSLYAVNIVNGATRPLVDLQDNVEPRAIGGEYDWAPDHQYMVIQGCCGGLFVTAFSSLNERKRLPGPSTPPYQEFQAWMPDGKQFLYTEPRGRGTDLWIWDIARWQGQKLFDNVLKAVPSPDGTLIALIQPQNQTWQPTIQNQPSLLPQEPLPALHLSILDVRTGKIQDMGNGGYSPLTHGLQIVEILWSPDGSELALRSFDQAWIIDKPE